MDRVASIASSLAAPHVRVTPAAPNYSAVQRMTCLFDTPTICAKLGAPLALPGSLRSLKIAPKGLRASTARKCSRTTTGWTKCCRSKPAAFPLDVFRRHQVFVSFPPSDQTIVVPIHQHFSSARAIVVIAAHGKAISTGSEYRHEVAALRLRKWPVLGQVIPALTDRPDDIDRFTIARNQV